MSPDSERAACILESRVVGDGSSTDAALCSMAVQVRKIDANRDTIFRWVGSMGQIERIDRDTLKAITDAITNGVETE